MHPALETSQVAGGMLNLAIDREPTAGGGRIRTMPGPLIADVGPDPRCLCLAVTRCLQLDRRVVGEDRRTAQDVTLDRVGQRLQQRRRLTDPAGQGRAIEIDAVALE